MATRSAIGFWKEDGIKAVYCHFDGYLSGVGKILIENYDRNKMEKLCEEGDISSLSEDLASTVFYCRDRNEPKNQTQAREGLSHDELRNVFRGCDYFYVLQDNRWFVSNSNSNADPQLLSLELRHYNIPFTPLSKGPELTKIEVISMVTEMLTDDKTVPNHLVKQLLGYVNGN